MEALRAIVVDDESLARKGLRIRLEQMAGMKSLVNASMVKKH